MKRAALVRIKVTDTASKSIATQRMNEVQVCQLSKNPRQATCEIGTQFLIDLVFNPRVLI
jgi:hypothetical protein